MKHFKFGHVEAREVNNRRLAAARRAIRLELAKVPLFPELVANTDPLARVERFNAAYLLTIADARNRRAAGWRAARARVAALPPATAEIVRRRWNTSPYPKTPEYLASLVHDVETGRWAMFPYPIVGGLTGAVR